MKAKTEITIIPSAELTAMRLSELAGRNAVLVEEDLQPRHYGWWVSLIGPEYQGEREWFIPLASIVA